MPTPQSGTTPPVHRIDLSLPPYSRYTSLAKSYATKIHSLTTLFDNLVQELVPSVPPSYIHTFAHLFLRRVYSDEETEELRGVADAVGVPMYLLVSFNVLLDVLMGCTSGGVRVTDRETRAGGARMLHFRTLDWGMDPLREVLVQLEFVRSKSPDPEMVVATSVAYVGFVGVLTGVREGLSMSLNFRPTHRARTRWENMSFYWGQFCVVLGWRRSIGSVLRGYLLPAASAKHEGTAKADNKAEEVPSLAEILDTLPSLPSTAAYLVFCSGTETYVLEKDNGHATVRSSTSFIATTNHDKSHESLTSTNTPTTDEAADPASDSDQQSPSSTATTTTTTTTTTTLNPETSAAVAPTSDTPHFSTGRIALGMTLQEAIEESTDRLSCLTTRWELHLLSQQQKQQQRKQITQPSVPKSELLKWLTAYPTTNECTHFACLMDPSLGFAATAAAAAAADGKEPQTQTQLGRGMVWIRAYGEKEVNGKGGGKVRDRLRRKIVEIKEEEGDVEGKH